MIIIIDTREQTAFRFGDGIETRAGTLATGDYSLAGLTELVAIERKSLADLSACIGPERDRFKRELHRLQAYRCRAVIIEADVDSVIRHEYRSKVTPASVLGSVASWQTRYNVPFVWAGDHGAVFTLAIMRNFHRQLLEVAEALNIEATA